MKMVLELADFDELDADLHAEEILSESRKFIDALTGVAYDEELAGDVIRKVEEVTGRAIKKR